MATNETGMLRDLNLKVGDKIYIGSDEAEVLEVIDNNEFGYTHLLRVDNGSIWMGGHHDVPYWEKGEDK